MSIEKELKKLLGRQFELEQNLLEFIREMIESRFTDPTELRIAKNEIDDMLDYFDFNGCLKCFRHFEEYVVKEATARKKHIKEIEDDDSDE